MTEEWETTGMMKRTSRRILAATLLAAVLASPGRAEDPLKRIESDPSPAVTERLSRLYSSAKGRDERFWVVQALGGRLRAHKDPRALDVLLRAARDREADVRRQALRELTAFGVLPPGVLGEGRRKLLEEAVRRGLADPKGGVRQGAEDLRSVLEGESPAQPLVAEPAPPPRSGGRLMRLLRLLWVGAWPLLAAAWAVCGFPVFGRDAEGERARRRWREACAHPGLLALAGILWALLCLLAAGHGFDALARLAGRPLYRAAWGPFSAYLAAGFCFLCPGVLFASRRGAGPVGEGLLRAALLSVVVFPLLLPAELVYRLLLRRVVGAGGARGGLVAVLEGGALRSAYAAAGAMAEGAGLLPAFEGAARGAALREQPLGRPCFHACFRFLCSGPAVGGVCLVLVAALPVEWSASGLRVAVGGLLWFLCVHAVMLLAMLQPLEALGCGDQKEDI